MAPSLSAIGAAAWDGCRDGAAGSADPFTSYAFLSALEESGCVAPETGWQPAHVHLKQAGAVVGVVPAYLKSHSYGEYVFDHAWADAFERAGGATTPSCKPRYLFLR